MRTIIHLLISGAAVLLAAYLLPGVAVESYLTAIGVALMLGVVALLLGPILTALTLPVNIATLGLFTLVIVAVLVEIVDAAIAGLYVANFGSAVLFGLLFAVINTGLEKLLGRPLLTSH